MVDKMSNMKVFTIVVTLTIAHLDLVKSDADSNYEDYRKKLQLYSDRLIKPEPLRHLTTTKRTEATRLKHIDYFKNLAHFDDADVRGPDWYNVEDNKSAQTGSEANEDEDRDLKLSSSSMEEKHKHKGGEQSATSSVETSEETRNLQRHRVCHPCPEDMIKRYTNLGIKWICGGYHQARRSFKSACMMRFRNCQDGTMFVKLYDRRCKDDVYHGKHFFYQYPV